MGGGSPTSLLPQQLNLPLTCNPLHFTGSFRSTCKFHFCRLFQSTSLQFQSICFTLICKFQATSASLQALLSEIPSSRRRRGACCPVLRLAPRRPVRPGVPEFLFRRGDSLKSTASRCFFFFFPVVPFYCFFFGWEGSPSKIDDGEKAGTLMLASLLEDLGIFWGPFLAHGDSLGLTRVPLSAGYSGVPNLYFVLYPRGGGGESSLGAEFLFVLYPRKGGSSLGGSFDSGLPAEMHSSKRLWLLLWMQGSRDYFWAAQF